MGNGEPTPEYELRDYCCRISPIISWLWRVRRDLLAHEMFMDQSAISEWRTWRDRPYADGGGGGLPPEEDLEVTMRVTRAWAAALGYRGDPGEVPPPPWGLE